MNTEIKFYVTKKQVNRYIELKKHKFVSLTEFQTTVENALTYLSVPKGFNKAQIKFFTRVLNRLKELNK